MALSKIIEEFRTFLQLERRVSINSIEGYSNDVGKFLTFLKQSKLGPIRAKDSDLFRFFQQLSKTGSSKSTLRRMLSSLKIFTTFLSKIGKDVLYNLKNIILPKMKTKLPEQLSSTGQDKLVDYILCTDNLEQELPEQARNKLIAAMLFGLGLRVSELCMLSLRNLSSDYKTLRVLGKGNKERILPVPDFLQKQLSYYLGAVRPILLEKKDTQLFSQYLFFSTNNNNAKPLSRQAIAFILKSLFEKLGIKSVSPHKLRHTIATSMLNSGANLRTIQQFLGHASIKTVQIYTHVQIDKLRKEYDKFHLRA